MSVRKPRSYDAEFKKNAVLLCDEQGRSRCSKEFGIPKYLLYRWHRELTAQKEIAFPGRGKEALTEEQREIKELRKRRQHTEMEHNILKKLWTSSAEHRNEIPIREVKRFYVSDEEAVPNPTNFHERILFMV